MQTEKFKVADVSIQQPQVENKLRSNYLIKQISQNYFKNQPQKNNLNQISMEKFIKKINNSNISNDKYSIIQQDYIKNKIPIQFIKAVQRYGSKDQYCQRNQIAFDEKVKTFQLQNQIDQVDQKQNNSHQNDSFISTHKMRNSQLENINSSISSKLKAQCQNNDISLGQIVNHKKIFQERVKNEEQTPESVNFLNQGNTNVQDNGNTLYQQQALSRVNIKQQIDNQQCQQYSISNNGENTYRINKLRVKSDLIQQSNMNQVEENNVIDCDKSFKIRNKQFSANHQTLDKISNVNHYKTILVNKNEQRNKRSKSQCTYNTLQRSISPIKQAIYKNNTLSHREYIETIENNNNLSSCIDKNFTQHEQQFQIKQRYKENQNHFDSQNDLKYKYINSINDERTKSISFAKNKIIFNSSKNDECSINSKNINEFPQINQSPILNKTFDTIEQKSTFSSPLTKNRRSQSNNCSSAKNQNSYQQNILQQYKCNNTKSSPLRYQKQSTLNTVANAISSRDTFNIDTIQEYSSSTSTLQNDHSSQKIPNHQNTIQFNIQNIPKIKLHKLNLKETNNSNHQQNALDNHSKKDSIFSVRMIQSRHSQMMSSPRSVTSTAKGHHEKLIYTHLNQLILSRNRASNLTSIPMLKQPTISIDSVLNGNNESSKFLRHYLNKVEILFSSIDRKDIDHIVLLISNLLDVLVEMNETNLFCQFVLFLGNISKEFNHIDKAVFFYNQLDTLAKIF